MGRLRLLNIDGGPIDVPLPPTATVGRAVGSDVRLDDDSVSRAHALIAWDGAAWTIRDLASQNGTTVGTRRLEAGSAEALRVGVRLGFGDVDAEVLDASAPRPIALSDHDVVEAEGTTLWLEPEGGLACVHFVGGAWALESQAGRVPVSDGEAIQVGGRRFVLRLPDALGPTHPTRPARTLDDLRLLVFASADLETVRVVACLPDREHDLGTRAHHGLVWLLAHRRRADRESGVSTAEAGWVDAAALPKLAAASENTLYTYVHRFRKQVEKLGVVDAPGIIERRLPGGQLRLGVPCAIEPLREADPR